ncbi:MAG: GumC family protein, partial [Fibrobacterota bacterium]
MELIEYWHLIRRRFLLIFLVTLAAVGLGTAYIVYSTPVYEADAKILVTDSGTSGAVPGFIGAGDMMLSAIGSRSDPLMTQIEIMKTRPVIAEAVRRLRLTDEEGNLYSSRQTRRLFSFSVVTNTNLIRLTCRHEEPEVASTLINTLAEVFIEKNEALNQERARVAKNFIEEQLLTQKQSLDSAEAAIVSYKQNIGSVSLEQETQLRIGGIAQLETELMMLESKLQGVYAEKNELEEKLSEPGARNSSLYSHWRAALEQANTQIASIEAQKQSIQGKITSRSRELSSLPAQEIEYANLVRDREIKKKLYVELLTQYEDFRIQEAANISTVKIIEPAVITEDPVEPAKKKILVLAFLAGIMIGFGGALILEYLDDTPRSLEEIKDILPYDFLGAVPFMKKYDPLYITGKNTEAAAEAIRLVQTNIKYTGILSAEHNMLMVTSSQPGEGKTTTTINLALSYAELGKKTAVVNLDLRRPAFHKILSEEYPRGITDFLVGDVEISDILYVNDFPHLSVVPSGTIPPNPSVLLANPRMEELMTYLKSNYDMVIFDTPPVTMVSETLSLAPFMSGIVLVVDSADSSTKLISRMAGVFEG